jgi:ABC-2 type transport system ATP-binding protein
MAHAIEVSNLTKRFGDMLAVDDLSFTVDEGRIVGFLGPNGTVRLVLSTRRPRTANRAHDVPLSASVGLCAQRA